MVDLDGGMSGRVKKVEEKVDLIEISDANNAVLWKEEWS